MLRCYLNNFLGFQFLNVVLLLNAVTYSPPPSPPPNLRGVGREVNDIVARVCDGQPRGVVAGLLDEHHNVLGAAHGDAVGEEKRGLASRIGRRLA